MRRQAITIGTSSLLVSAAVFTLSRDFPSFKVRGVQLPGPAFFPNLIAGGLFLCGLAEIILAFLGAPAEPERKPGNGRRLLRDEGFQNTCLVVACVIAYAFLQDSLGFLVTTFLLCAVIMSRLKINLAKSILASAAVTVAIAVIFARILMVPLPQGILSFW